MRSPPLPPPLLPSCLHHHRLFRQDESESVHVVRSFHDGSGPASGLVEVAGGCRVFGKVEGHMVVCDGCERGFHLGCAGMGGRQAVHFMDWLCGECACKGVKSKLWPLGVKSKRILDINASPLSDGDVETTEERMQESLHLPKKRESKRSSLANGFPANGDGLLDGFDKEFLSNHHSEEIGDAKFVKVNKDKMEGDEITTSQPSTEGLPIKFEDFFILALGKIDLRPLYHDASMIWPIGY